MAAFEDIESESLPAHVSICHQRYLHLESRLHTMESRIEKIERGIEDIKKELQIIAAANSSRWTNAQIAVIGILMGVVGWLLPKILFP